LHDETSHLHEKVDRVGLEISHLHEKVDRVGLEISHLHEKARFNREECDRISSLYDSVTARMASLEQRMANQEQRLSGIGEPCIHPQKSPAKQIQDEDDHQAPMTRVERNST
jgi:hypothetical protein